MCVEPLLQSLHHPKVLYAFNEYDPTLICTSSHKYLNILKSTLQTIWDFRNKVVACVELHNFCFFFKLKMIE